MKRIVTILIAAAIVAVVVLRIVQASAPVEAAPDVEEIRARTGIPVEIATVERGSLEVRRSFTGTLRGIRHATVRARTGDEIVEIPVRVGQRVKSGDVLVRQSTQGSMASVQQAEAAYEQARRTVDRLRPLHEKGAVSDQDWDNALTGLRVAEANLEAARKAVILTSPIDGTVTDVLETPGSFPGAGDPLVRVTDLSRLQALLQVSPQQSEELSLGQKALLPEAGLEGRITRIGLHADPKTRLVEVEVTFPGGPGGGRSELLVPGSLARVEIVVGERDSVLLIPTAADQGGQVWVLDGEDRAHLVPFRAGLTGSDRMEVLEGLAEGDRVVVAGASLLSEGAQTRIVGG